MKELKIGEEIRIRCVDSDELHSCTECIFFQLECHNLGASCMASERSDKKDVHFEMVEQNEGKELLYAVNKTAERTKKEMIRKA